MQAASKTLIPMLALALPLALADDRPHLRPIPRNDQNLQTGPAIGAHIPDFEAVDQDGHRRTFEDLRGPRGLALLFFRTADW